MNCYRTAVAAMSLGCAILAMTPPVGALDLGGQNGVSIGSNSSGGLAVSVGGSDGVNASVGGTPAGGLGVDASVGGSSGIHSNTSVGGSNSSALGVSTTASVGGSRGVNGDVNATLGSSSLATASTNARVGSSRGLTGDVDAEIGGTRPVTASANIGAGGNTLANIRLGLPASGGSNTAVDDASANGIANPGTGNSTNSPREARMAKAINDMSAADRAKAKVRCKDVLRSGGYEASLTKLCRMVLAMR